MLRLSAFGVTCLVLMLSALASARTVVLVYDDSGSMLPGGNPLGEARDVFANYSLQNLAALMSPDDRLVVVRMSDIAAGRSPTTLLANSTTGKREAIATVALWGARGGTPYASVTLAIEQLLAILAEDALAPVRIDEDYWLVVLSDGEFQFTDGRDTTVQDVTNLRERFAGRRFGVIYLGIGSTADTLAQPWDAAGATVFTARTAPEITDAMFSIAALITGRDPEGGVQNALEPRIVGDTVVLESPLPLRRLTVFHQGLQPADVRVTGALFRGADGRDLRLFPDGAYHTQEAGLYGVVTVVAEMNNNVLPPGRYTLTLQTDLPDLSTVRFLPEVALELALTLLPSADALCIGQEVTVRAQLLNPQTNNILGGLPGIIVTGTLEDVQSTRAEPLAFVPEGDAFVSRFLMPEGERYLAVTARLPGLFNLRSPLLSLSGSICPANVGLSLTPDNLMLLPRFTPNMQEGGRSTLRLNSDAPGSSDTAPYTLSVTGLPEGTELELLNQRLSPLTPQINVTLPLDTDIPLIVLTNERFQQEEATLELSIVNPDGSVTLTNNRADLRLQLEPLPLTLTPASSTPLSVTRTAEEALSVVGEVALVPRALEPVTVTSGVRYALSADSLPPGVALELLGVPLTPGTPLSLELQLDQPLPVTVLRNRDFRQSGDSSVTLSARSLDPRVRFIEENVQLLLNQQPRTLSLEPLEGDYRVPLTELREAAPYRLVPFADGERVSPEELATWNVRILSPSGLRVQHRITEDGLLELSPLPHPIMGLTPTGDLPLEVTLSTPFDERATLPARLTVEDMPWWVKWGSIIIALLILFVLLWWLFGLLTKARFSRGAVLEYARYRKRPGPLRKLERPDAVYTHALRQYIPRLSYIIPYRPERAEVEGLVFEAARAHNILLLEPPEPEGLLLNQEPLRRGATLMRPNSELHRDGGRDVEKYVYRTD